VCRLDDCAYKTSRASQLLNHELTHAQLVPLLMSTVPARKTSQPARLGKAAERPHSTQQVHRHKTITRRNTCAQKRQRKTASNARASDITGLIVIASHACRRALHDGCERR
jgi:hypothetical protein